MPTGEDVARHLPIGELNIPRNTLNFSPAVRQTLLKASAGYLETSPAVHFEAIA
jgi:hypothetical protein